MRIAMVAGEHSGDLLASYVLPALKSQATAPAAMQLQGIGGPRMVEQGFEAWWPMQKLAVRGYVEVLRHYSEIRGIQQDLIKRLQQDKPHVFVGVDAPDFNLSVELALREADVPTVHFISPSIWAWRFERIEKIKRAVGHMLVVFPFEQAIYEQHGVRATYVGHPLASAIPQQPDVARARQQLGYHADDVVVALLPGSRLSEIKQLLARMLEAARLLQAQQPQLKFVLPAPPGSVRQAVDQVVAQSGSGLQNLQLLDGQSHAALAACNVTLIASGTATLEAMLFKKPMVITYHMPWLSWKLMKRKHLQPWVGLPNILCREFVVPELIQEQATPQQLAQAVRQQLDDEALQQRLALRFSQLHQELARDTAQLAAQAILQEAGRGN